MAETAEEIIARLEADMAREGQRASAQAAADNEAPDAIIARLERDMARETERTEGPRGMAWLASLRDPAYFYRNAASIAGLVGSPVIGPLTRPAPGTPEREAIDTLPATERLDEEISRSRDAAVGLMERIGLVPPNLPERPDTLLGHAYASLPGAALFGAGTIAAAPTVAARFAGSTSAAGQTAGRIATGIAEHPATAARAVVASDPGMVIAREAARPAVEAVFDPESQNLLSQAARSATMFGIEMLGSIPTERLARAVIPVPKAERFSPRTPYKQPILRDQIEPETAGRIARTRSVEFQDAIDRQIARTLERTGVAGLDEVTASRNLRGGLLAAREYAAAEEARAWSEVDSSITGRPGSFINLLEEMLATAKDKPGVADNWPVQLLERIRAQLIAGRYYTPGTPGTPPTVTPVGGAPWQPGQGIPPLTAPQVTLRPGTAGTPGRMVPQWKDMPVKDLQEIRSRLLTEGDRAAETSVLQPRPNLVLRDNIGRLVDELTNSIDAVGAAVDPKFSAAYEYARLATKLKHERFHRGPVGELLMTTRQSPFAKEGIDIPIGGNRVPASQFARAMLGEDETALAVREAGQTFGAQLANPPLGGLAQQRVRTAGDEAVRTMFRDDVLRRFEDMHNRAAKPRSIEDIQTTYTTQPGPARTAVTEAQRWLADNGPVLEGWTETTTRLGKTVERLKNLLNARNAHTQSVLSQFIGRNATEVFEESLRAPNTKARFELLYRTFKNNPTFLEGAQRALIDMVFAGRGMDPTVALSRLERGSYHDALEALFKGNPKALDRLYENVRLAQETLGDVVSATAGGRARIDPGRAKELNTTAENIVRGTTTWAARIFGLGAGGIVARVLPFMGSAGSLSIPMRFGRGASEYIAYKWAKNNKEMLDIVRDATFDKNLEARLHDLAPGNYKELLAQNKQINRYLRRVEAATNEDVDEYLTANSDRLYWQERRAIRQEMARARTGPFKR